MKKIALKILILFMSLIAIPLSGCGSAADLISNVANSAAQIISGNVTGEVGKKYSTQWFDFTVMHIEETGEYAGYKPSAGNKLYDVLITQTGTFEESIPMGTYDFYMDAPSFEEYVFPMDPIDETMMPADYELSNGDKVEYHMIFEIPAGTSDLVLEYTEIDEDEGVGAVFTIKIG